MSKQSSLPWLSASLVVLVFSLLRTVLFPFWRTDCDCAMYLSAAQQLLAGQRPYIDFIDLNPPFIFYLSTIPVLISKVLAIPVEITFTASVYFFSLICWGLAAILLLRYRNRDYFLSGPILFGFAVFTFTVGEWGQYGQRHHLLALALVPFFICRYQRAFGRPLSGWLAAAVGVIFGTLLTLIPQYGIIPASCELFFLIKARRFKTLFSPEMLGAAAAFIFSLLLGNILLPPESRAEYIGRWLPMIISGYSAYNGDIFIFTVFPFLIGCLPLFFIGLIYVRSFRHDMSQALTVFCLAAYAAMLIQMKGFWDHYIPFLCGSTLFLCVQVAVQVQARKRFNSLALWMFETIVLLTLCIAPNNIIRETHSYYHEDLDVIRRQSQPSQAVAILSADVPDVFPTLLEAGRPNAVRYLFLFPIQMLDYEIKNSRSQAQADKYRQAREKIFQELLCDLDTNKPVLILISEGRNEKRKLHSTYHSINDYKLIERLHEHYSLIGVNRGRISDFYTYKLTGAARQ